MRGKWVCGLSSIIREVIGQERQAKYPLLYEHELCWKVAWGSEHIFLPNWQMDSVDKQACKGDEVLESFWEHGFKQTMEGTITCSRTCVVSALRQHGRTTWPDCF